MNLNTRNALYVLLLTILAACDSGTTVTEQTAQNISAIELSERISAGAAPLILDVRSQDEFDAGHIPGAILITHEKFLDSPADTLNQLPEAKNTEIVLHCHSGKRAGMVNTVLKDAGFSNVRSLEGDWIGWQASDLPVAQ